MIDKYPFNNCWCLNHPTINFFTFDVEVVTVFGHKCILEKYQDGEICSDDEYWGSVLYDFDNDRYIHFSAYVNEEEIEDILNRLSKINSDICEGKISEDFDNEEAHLGINFYKSYLQSCEKIELESYYNRYYESNN